jgi:hypothetical protein
MSSSLNVDLNSKRLRLGRSGAVMRGASGAAVVAVAAMTLSTVAAGAEAASWAIQSTPRPAGAVISELHGVSCISTTACTAVGDAETSTTVGILTGRWNGIGWAFQYTPNPLGAYDSLFGLSCTSTTACAAVGEHETSQGFVSLAERWNGTKWTLQSTPNPPGSTNTFLTSVSCTSTTACTAVGLSDAGNGTLVERWNGTGWTIQSTPNPAGSGAVLSGVSCASPTDCIAVGSYSRQTSSGLRFFSLAEGWNGTGWAIESTPNPPGSQDTELHGVSCTSTAACTAVGQSDAGTLGERWNGTSWAIQSTPNPGSSFQDILTAVSCPVAKACIAVGIYSNPGSGSWLTLAEIWNGTGWAIQSTPNPSGSPRLVGVSCTSATLCTAVGFHILFSKTLTLAELYS